jgi:sodium transport system permease protein
VKVSESLVVFRKEARDILRDRRSLFFAFVLPLFLYPAMFLVSGKLQEAGQRAVAANPSRIGAPGAGPALLERLRADPDLEVETSSADWGVLERGELDLLLILDTPLPGERGAKPLARVYFDGASPASATARRRIEDVLAEYRDQMVRERFGELGASVDPRGVLAFSAFDLSDPGERSGAALGRLLPFILVALLLTGGAFAAVDLIAGEKERGTLETLFIQPIDGGSVMMGKFLAVLIASLAAVVLNLLGMAAALALGLGPAGSALSLHALPSALSLAAVLVLLIPLAVLSSAILLAVSTYARSYREAQMYLLPLTLVSMVPAFLATAPDIHLSAVVCVIPITNAALAIRDALAGHFSIPYLAAAFLSTAFYAAAALRWTAKLLEREDLRLGIEGESLLGASTIAARSRRALAFGIIMIAFIALAGSAAQRPEGPLGIWGGLAFTLWVLVLLPALLYLKAFRLPVAGTIALRRPRLRHLIAALALVAPAAVLVTAWMVIQDRVLPFPEGFKEKIEQMFGAGKLGLVPALAIIALSPAICEEVLWRGVVQGEIEKEGRPLKTVLLVGLLFGIFHLDIYRLVPTAALGCVLAALRLRARSIIPCMLFHGVYNGAMFVGSRELGEGFGRWMLGWQALLGAAVLLAVGWRLLAAGAGPDRRPIP